MEDMDCRINVKLAEQREELFKTKGIDQNGLELLQDYDHDKDQPRFKG